MRIVKIGCCGFPLARSKYYREYSVVELQNTFYELPSLEWCSRIRSEAPDYFEFVVKAWQVLTHPSNSPTWRRMKKKVSGDLEKYGFLKPTRENLEAFSKVLDVAHILRSRIIVLQTPPSMVFNDEVFNSVREFFKEVSGMSSKEVLLAWEPRGEWAVRIDVLSRIIEDFNVIHVTDILKSIPLPNSYGLIYTRLHGLNGEVNYKYKYTVEDFTKLKSILMKIDFREAYVMFNNTYMKLDASSFKEFLSRDQVFIVK
ncbi:MAG: DUF72 domain-containing protein [Desulfurococcaceae archaeon]